MDWKMEISLKIVKSCLSPALKTVLPSELIGNDVKDFWSAICIPVISPVNVVDASNFITLEPSQSKYIL